MNFGVRRTQLRSYASWTHLRKSFIYLCLGIWKTGTVPSGLLAGCENLNEIMPGRSAWYILDSQVTVLFVFFFLLVIFLFVILMVQTNQSSEAKEVWKPHRVLMKKPFKDFCEIISWTYGIDFQLEQIVVSGLRLKLLTFTYSGKFDRGSTHLTSHKSDWVCQHGGARKR